MSTEYEVYHAKRISEIRAEKHRYYLVHKEKIMQRSTIWRKSHTERRRQIKMKSRHNVKDGMPRKRLTNLTYYVLRTNLMNLLGNKCVKCGFADMRALCFDHINGGGHREYLKYKAATFYRHYLADIQLAKANLQVLCANCNSIKRSINRESAWKHKS